MNLENFDTGNGMFMGGENFMEIWMLAYLMILKYRQTLQGKVVKNNENPYLERLGNWEPLDV